MTVATPNNTRVNPTCRSRSTVWSAADVRPKMLYSAVFASASGEFGTRDKFNGVRGLNADKGSCSGASDADMNPGVLDTTGVTRGLFRPGRHPLDTITS